MLEAIGDEFWLADGPTVQFLGLFPYPTRMALVRLRDGSLFVWSPIALGDELIQAVCALGPPRHLIAPNLLHHLFLADWLSHFPEARLYAAPGLARRRRDLCFDAELGDEPEPAWAGEIDQVVVRGSVLLEEVLFFHRASRTLLITDLVQRFDPATQRGWRGLAMRLDGLVGPKGSTPRDLRMTFLRRARARRARAKALAWNPERLLLAHGNWVREGGRDELERALAWMG